MTAVRSRLLPPARAVATLAPIAGSRYRGGVPSPLKSSRLRRILAAYTVNRLGTWFGLVALSLAVFDHTHSALAVAALLLAWQALPAFVVPAVVARVEASKRRGELSALYFFEAFTTAVLALLLWHFWLPAVLLLAALDGTAALAASALLRAEVAKAARDQVEAQPGDETRPSESREEDTQEAERKANAALNVAFSATFVLGPVLGGTVVATAGAPAALLIDVGSFLALRRVADRSTPPCRGGRGRLRARSAPRRLASHQRGPSLRALLLVEAVAIIFAESAGPIEVAYAKATLHAGDRGFGLLLGTWGAGAVLGSLVFARSLRRPLGTLLSAGTLAVGLAYVGFAASPSLVLACVAALIGGIGNGVELPSLTSIVQRLTPPHLHGRMMGAVESMTALSLAIGLPLGGALVALSSPRAAFLVVGLGALATSAALLRVSRKGPRSVINGEERDPAVGSAVTVSKLHEPTPH